MKKQYKISRTTKYLLLATLFLAALGERVLFDLGPNFELITTAVILSSFYVSRKQSFWTVFLIMLFSDLIIGNTNIFIFTWSGFLIPTLLSKNIIMKVNLLISQITNCLPAQTGKLPITKNLSTSTSLTLSGLLANIFFFIWTNFGVWLLSGMYPKTPTGLSMSYINALPFLKYQLISTLIFVPSIFILTEVSLNLVKNFRYKKTSIISSLDKSY